MPSAKDPLMEDGLAALRDLLPPGYSVAKSSLGKGGAVGATWIVVRGQVDKGVTCLLVARRRVETRDLGTIAAIAARTNNPAFLVSTYLSPMVRERLRGFGIGHWDLTGNARIALAGIDLCLERDSGAPAADKNDRRMCSLCGEMAGRVARVLIDVRSPHTLSGVAEQARVDTSCVSRVVAFLDESGIVERQSRGKIAKVHWQELLRRWSLDAPLHTRGQSFRFLCARGVSDFLGRLARSGFLHALTGESGLAGLAATPIPTTAVLYVDEVDAAVAQFGLHPARDETNVILVKPADRSVFQRSREAAGLRYVSPSLMAADLGNGDTFEAALHWMIKHESSWRQPSAAVEVRKASRRAKRR
jgi:hypothetical protein